MQAVGSFPPRRLKQGECRSAFGDICRLCAAHAVNYEEEQSAKNAALRNYWAAEGFGFKLDPLVPSPRGRFYRVVSKRRAFNLKGRIRLALNELNEGESSSSPLQVGMCVIEPEAHAKIYLSVEAILEKRGLEEVRNLLNHVVIKGSYEEFALILNLAAFPASLRKEVNVISRGVTESIAGVSGVFVVVDPTRSGYYMPQYTGGRKSAVQKVFGRSEILNKVDGRRFLYSPAAFSQTNLSILEKLVEGVGELLRPDKNDILLDLYSGYGLFTLCLAGRVTHAIGMEISPEAIRDADANAMRQGASNCEFIAGDINGRSCFRVLSEHRSVSSAILDPPRNGTKPGVIEAFKGKEVSRVVHVFCNLNIVAQELERWGNAGYRAQRAIPFDMFPGTSEVELAVLLERR